MKSSGSFKKGALNTGNQIKTARAVPWREQIRAHVKAGLSDKEIAKKLNYKYSPASIGVIISHHKLNDSGIPRNQARSREKMKKVHAYKDEYHAKKITGKEISYRTGLSKQLVSRYLKKKPIDESLVRKVLNKIQGKQVHDFSVNAFHKNNPHLHHLGGDEAATVFGNHVHQHLGVYPSNEQRALFSKHWNRIRTGTTTSVPIVKK